MRPESRGCRDSFHLTQRNGKRSWFGNDVAQLRREYYYDMSCSMPIYLVHGGADRVPVPPRNLHYFAIFRLAFLHYFLSFTMVATCQFVCAAHWLPFRVTHKSLADGALEAPACPQVIRLAALYQRLPRRSCAGPITSWRKASPGSDRYGDALDLTPLSRLVLLC